jgi:hypothetical protein
MGQHYAPETIFDGKNINFFTYTQNGWVRELHKKNELLAAALVPSGTLSRTLSNGILPVLVLLAGFSARTTRNFGIFLKLEVS